MTPTEQDSELREKINSLFESVFSQGMRAGKDVASETYEDFDAWHKKNKTDEILKLIIADRKRVALGAKIEVCDKYLGFRAASDTEHEAIQWLDFQRDELHAELKSQQEEV